MTTTIEPGGQSFEQLVFGADALRERIGAAVDRAIAGIDPASTRGGSNQVGAAPDRGNGK